MGMQYTLKKHNFMYNDSTTFNNGITISKKTTKV